MRPESEPHEIQGVTEMIRGRVVANEYVIKDTREHLLRARTHIDRIKSRSLTIPCEADKDCHANDQIFNKQRP